MLNRHYIVILLILTALDGKVKADIRYNQKENALVVTDFPENAPCTLPHLVVVDRNFGWRKIWFDETNNAYTLDGSLMIGNNDGTETCFAIGASGKGETLIVRGNVMIMPYWRKGDTPGKYWGNVDKKVNRLILGDPGDEKIKGVLKIDCSDDESRGLYSGHIMNNGAASSDGAWGGQLEAYNSAIAACGAKQAGVIKLSGDSAILSNSVISNVKHVFSIRTFLEYQSAHVENTVFSNAGCPIYQAGGYSQEYKGCIFEECQTVFIRTGKSIYGNGYLFKNCVFRNNRKTWRLSPDEKPVILTDCDFIGENTKGHEDEFMTVTDKASGKKTHAQLISKRRVVVQVADESGNCISGAVVRIKAEQPGTGLLENVEYITGAKGMTPGKDDNGGILLYEYLMKSSDNPIAPQTITFSYEFIASKNGKTVSLKGVRPDKSRKAVKLILK